MPHTAMVLLAVCDRELIENCLQKAGVCPRCRLRFTGEKFSGSYRDTHTDPDLGDPPAAAEQSKRPRPNCCVACLGTLQDHVMVPLLDGVADTLNTCGYDADTFSLQLQLPMCISIRQHALLVHLRHQLPASCVAGLRDEQVVSIKQVWKYIYPDMVADKVKLEHQYEDNGFSAEIQAEWAEESSELESLLAICPEEYATRAKNIHVYNMGVFSRMGIERSLSGVEDSHFARHYPVPPPVPGAGVTVSTKLQRGSCFLGGRYCKYSRQLPQTPWFVNNERKCETSVEELLADCINSTVLASEIKFLASGREDVDVRMLGSGRPFAIECCNPKRSKFSADELMMLEKAFNEKNCDISVHDLTMVSKDKIRILKEGEEEKKKFYTALCVTSVPVSKEKFRELEKIQDLKLLQQTPIRVLHRRANAFRDKMVHSMKFSTDGLHDNMFKLELLTSAGTYVKEFVHGDFNRTKPNLRSLLGVDTDILALDVMEVQLPWPPVMQ